MTEETFLAARDEARHHLTRELLPFWLTRIRSRLGLLLDEKA